MTFVHFAFYVLSTRTDYQTTSKAIWYSIDTTTLNIYTDKQNTRPHTKTTYPTTTIKMLTTTKTILFASALAAGAFANPISTAPSSTITSSPSFYERDADGTEWCSSQGVIYDCALSTEGIPDFSTAFDDIHIRDEEAATSALTTPALTTFATAFTESAEPTSVAEVRDLTAEASAEDYSDYDDEADDEDEADEEDAEADEHDEHLNTIEARKPPIYAQYCSSPGVCSTIPIKRNHDCVTFAGYFPIMSFPPGQKCDLYSQGSCAKDWFRKKGATKNVQGYIDVRTDATAIKNGVTGVGSFRC